MLKNNRRMMYIVLSGIITCVLMLIIFWLHGFQPFGVKTLACDDAYIQYLDFYSYFKDVVAGKNSILYSFGKTLGGTNIAVFSYYLSSPFVWLTLLFSKSQLNTYFNISVLLKLTLASMTFCYYLFKRFEGKVDNRYKKLLVILLSVAYSLSQYSVAQASNVMWLDGVYMLPLILLGVYNVVNSKGGWKLSAVIGYSIIANWYIAGINCLFSGIWFLVEYFLDRKEIKTFISLGLKYVLYMIVGVMLSACLFLPTLKALQNSSRGAINLQQLLSINFNGHIGSAIQNYSYGALSSNGSVALFCGSVALIGMLCFFFNKVESTYKKIVLGCIAIFNLLCYYFVPFSIIFTLLKEANSYWYRFSHLGIFIIIFIAAQYFILAKKADCFLPLKCGLGFATLLLVLDNVHSVNDSKQTSMTALMFIILGAVLSLIEYYIDSDKSNRLFVKAGAVLLSVLSVWEYSHNAILLMNRYSISDVSSYCSYSKNQEEMIGQIKDYDGGLYRMSQTSTRNMLNGGLTANYNEALAYDYWSISGYTSSPDDNQRDFLDNLGYCKCGLNMCIVNTSILGADTLLGVKYVMSEYPINGLKKVDEINSYNEKALYENPFSLPMALVYSKFNEGMDKTNPFEYQNSIYCKLAGNDSKIYQKLEYSVEKLDGNNSYSIKIPSGNYAVYGNIPYNNALNATLDVNSIYSIFYACWLSQSVFYVPTSQNDTIAKVSISAENLNDINDDNTCFYALDLDKLQLITDKLRMGEPKNCEIEDGYINVSVSDASKNQNLLLAVPYDKGWTITRNGKRINVTKDMLIGDCLYSIPLDEGENNIEMKYHVQGLALGICISVIAIIVLIGIQLYKKKHKEK